VNADTPALWATFKQDYNKSYASPTEEAYRFTVFKYNYGKKQNMVHIFGTLFFLLLAKVNADTPALWATFKQDYNKSYASPTEEAYRFTVFKYNYREAMQMDAAAFLLYNETYGEKRVRYGINSLSDMNQDEFRSMLMSDMPPANKSRVLPIPVGNVDIPATWDWRTHGVITGVYNQGQCGSCWTFSATECVEAATALAGKGLHNLSPQQIVDCDDESQHGCKGGWPMAAWEYIHSVGGQDSMACYPYTGTDGSCHFNPACRQGTVNSYGYLGTNEYNIGVWMVAHGPVSICVDASNWQYYNGGVVPTTSCGKAIDHAIQMVGYVTGQPSYWIVRNSWGPGWGPYGGYIYLEYGQNTCGLAQYAAGAVY